MRQRPGPPSASMSVQMGTAPKTRPDPVKQGPRGSLPPEGGAALHTSQWLGRQSPRVVPWWVGVTTATAYPCSHFPSSPPVDRHLECLGRGRQSGAGMPARAHLGSSARAEERSSGHSCPTLDRAGTPGAGGAPGEGQYLQEQLVLGDPLDGLD